MSERANHSDSELEMQAFADLMAAADVFDTTGRTHEQLVRAIDALIDAKVAAAIEHLADRVEEALGASA